MVSSSILNDVASDDEDLSSNSSEDPQDEFEDSEGGDDISNEDYDGGDDDDDEEEQEEEEEDDDEDDDEDDEPQLGEPESEDETVGNAGWADAMAKVLAMGKNSSKPVSVLSKAKKGNSTKRKSCDGEGEGSSDSDPEPEKKLEPLAVRKAKKKEIDSIGRKMPNVLERNSERILSKIATKGVVQLFNAVRDHQKDVKTKLKDAGGSFRKQEKVYKNLDKRSFIEMLSGKSGSEQQAGGDSRGVKKQKLETAGSGASTESSSWNILRDDYMLGAKLKDWDKDSDEET